MSNKNHTTAAISSKFWTIAVAVSEAFQVDRALQAVADYVYQEEAGSEQALLLKAYELCFEEVREKLGIKSSELQTCEDACERIDDEYPAQMATILRTEARLKDELEAAQAHAGATLNILYRVRAQIVFALCPDTALDSAKHDYEAAQARVNQLLSELAENNSIAFEESVSARRAAAQEALNEKLALVEMLDSWKLTVTEYVRNSLTTNALATQALTKAYLLEDCVQH